MVCANTQNLFNAKFIDLDNGWMFENALSRMSLFWPLSFERLSFSSSAVR